MSLVKGGFKVVALLGAGEAFVRHPPGFESNMIDFCFKALGQRQPVLNPDFWLSVISRAVGDKRNMTGDG